MQINKSDAIPDPQVTTERMYRSRRQVMRAGILVGSVAATGWIYRKLNPRPFSGAQQMALTPQVQGIVRTSATQPAIGGLGPDDEIAPFQSITHYNNFYEFDTSKEGVADAAAGFVSRPWTVEVGGLCGKPKTFDIDELLKISPPEERVYRMRCVEGWSMVIPWVGFSMSKLLDRVEPTSAAKYVGFQTLLDPTKMPNQQGGVLPWPYREGLRMVEAMHPLTILASGLYGRQLPPQNGAPLRLVIPWKYGFKGIKSIVKITLSATQPVSTWNAYGPGEYGFYSNVNPDVDHPRWSQKTETRLTDTISRRPTLMFNGYADQVAHLYAGMDLRRNF